MLANSEVEGLEWLESAARMEHVLAREVLAFLRREQPSSVANSGSRLCEYMQWLSESCWCAGWMDGIEFELWEAWQRSDAFGYGGRIVAPLELETLAWLSRECGGWVTWSVALGSPVFVDLPTWQGIVEKRRADS
jgi:hypothetical protein